MKILIEVDIAESSPGHPLHDVPREEWPEVVLHAIRENVIDQGSGDEAKLMDSCGCI